ncbi:MAG: hypothetical protein Q4B65_02585 [Candidatus Saccharibacteria bacterium]|nr:hypothetical protein [Candidatus Saccharibacteria bacterium]
MLADGSSELAEALTYNPATCAELYEGEKLKNQGAFVIDTNKLYLLNPSSNVAFEDAWPQILITPETSGVTFSAPSTYPRLIHANATENESILDQDKNVDTESLSRVEGLYIVPIKDQGDTVIIQGTTGQKKSAYYDFYIRSCWYGPGADHPSTISTVIRLYDPNIIDYSTP